MATVLKGVILLSTHNDNVHYVVYKLDCWSNDSQRCHDDVING